MWQVSVEPQNYRQFCISAYWKGADHPSLFHAKLIKNFCPYLFPALKLEHNVFFSLLNKIYFKKVCTQQVCVSDDLENICAYIQSMLESTEGRT